jgi:hypothetical protein
MYRLSCGDLYVVSGGAIELAANGDLDLKFSKMKCNGSKLDFAGVFVCTS